MSSDRHPRRDPPPPPGRSLRWSHRYNTFQVASRYNGAVTWRNVRPELARCYAAAGVTRVQDSIF